MRKGRFLISILIVLSLILPGCQQEVPMADPVAVVEDVEPTATYDWMAGESPVPNKRIGTVRAGLAGADVAVSPTGVYFLPAYTVTSEQYIMYVDDGSDQVIKLCGRADCTHENTDCNAYIKSGSDLSYYGGHLYVVTGEGGNSDQCELIRMQPDGSGREVLMDLTAFAKENGGSYIHCDMITNGFCYLSVYGWKKNEDGTAGSSWLSSYVYWLDGSSKEPQKLESEGWSLYYCGDVFLTFTGVDTPEEFQGTYWHKDVKTDTLTYLTEHPGIAGWYGREEAYYFRDGAIVRLDYATQEEEVMVDTGLEGEYYAFALPDCLVVGSDDFGEEADDTLYFYNWEFQLVDTVQIDYPHNELTSGMIIGETAERILLTDWFLSSIPKYYINKSELGSGDVQIHEFLLPEIDPL